MTQEPKTNKRRVENKYFTGKESGGKFKPGQATAVRKVKQKQNKVGEMQAPDSSFSPSAGWLECKVVNIRAKIYEQTFIR